MTNAPHPAAVDVNGTAYLRDAKGSLVPLAAVKRPDLATDDGRAVVQSTVDAIEDVFIAAIARGRGVSEAIVRSDFGQGGTMVGGPAVKARMADRVEADGLDGAIRRLATRTSSTRRTAAENTLKLAHARAGL